MIQITIALIVAFITTSALAADKPSNKHKQTTLNLYLTPTEAFEMKDDEGAEILFIDVRTQAEQEIVGQPVNLDKNIPYKFRDLTKYNDKSYGYAKVANKKFIADMQTLVKAKGLNKNTKIIFICRAGYRSATAVNMVAKEGFTHAYTVTTGVQGDKNPADYNKRNQAGWINDDLPWTSILSPEKMYFR